MKSLFRPIFFALLAFCLAGDVIANDVPIADRVEIRKSDRKLVLFRNDEVLKSMDIALGLVPKGDKRSEGDFRTPEGRYLLTERNPASDFFLSIKISYPDKSDVKEARRLGLQPGGQIMIHGQPNAPKHGPDYYRSADWTDGCVAVSNSDMVDVWLMTRPGTPVQISP